MSWVACIPVDNIFQKMNTKVKDLRPKDAVMRFAILCLLTLAGVAQAEPLTLAPVSVTEWKAVYGRIEARDRIPARARLGGTLMALDVAEGDEVTAGQVLAQIVDEKLAFQLSALEAQVASVQAQLVNAQAELKRGEDLLKQGVITVQRLDVLRTQVDVFTGQILTVEAQRKVCLLYTSRCV